MLFTRILDTDYCVIVPDLPGCITAGDTLEDVQNQVLEAIQCHIEGMLLDGELVPEARSIAYHKNNPDYADGTWKSTDIYQSYHGGSNNQEIAGIAR